MDGLLAVASVAAIIAAIVASLVAVRARVAARRDRSAAERADERLRAVLETSGADRRSASLVLSRMQEGVLLFAPGGRTTYANPAIDRHLGAPPTTADELPEGLRRLVRDAALTRLASETEVELDRSGTAARWLRGAATPTGEDDSVLLVLRDVTEARRLDAVRRDFVANASHELRTPAASILAAAETIQDAARDDPVALGRFAAQIEADAGRLSRIVSDLLDLSRLEGGTAGDDLVALDELARQEVERLRAAADDAGVELEVAAEPVALQGSARDLALLIRNLVDNALQYTARGGRVQVAVGPGDEEAMLTVSDTGIGIDPVDLPRIFERFYRVDRARSRETGGTGLGLSIVRHVVENHGGTIEVSSEPGRGTRFEVRLPAFDGAAPSAERRRPPSGA